MFFLCVTAVSSVMLVGIWKFNHSAGAEEPEPPDMSVNTQQAETVKGGISGAEVKKHLSGLTEDSDEAVMVASLGILMAEEMPDASYLVFPLNMDQTRRRIVIGETAYALTGINYGAVLSDSVLKTVSAEGGGLYTQCGFLAQDSVGEYGDTQIVWKTKFHPWEPGSVSIGDDERFYKETVYGPDSQKIGVFYYPME